MASEWALRQRAIQPQVRASVFASAPPMVDCLVDGKHRATAHTAYPKGTKAHPYPHARVSFEKGPKNVPVKLERLTRRT